MVDLTKVRDKQKKFKPKKYRAYDLEGSGDKAPIVEKNTPEETKVEEQATPATAPSIQEEATVADIPEVTLNQQLLAISPLQCKPWQFADRSDAEMGDIEELSNSIKANGQQEPALVRPIPVSNLAEGLKYEVIFGHRRWLACKLANKPFLVMVKNLSDQEAAVAQKEENENRQNLSPYSKAIHYKRLLDEKVFNSERELAANLNISKSSLNLLMAYNRIPGKLCKALGSMHELPIRTADKLASLSKTATDSELDHLCTLAADISSGKLPFNKIQSAFQKQSVTSSSKTKQEKTVYKTKFGVQLFTSGLNQNNAHTFTFHKVIKDNSLVKELETLVHQFLAEKFDNSK